MLELVFRALQGLAVALLLGGPIVIVWQVNRPTRSLPVTRLETLPAPFVLPPT